MEIDGERQFLVSQDIFLIAHFLLRKYLLPQETIKRTITFI